jgi:hypothetical protein
VQDWIGGFEPADDAELYDFLKALATGLHGIGASVSDLCEICTSPGVRVGAGGMSAARGAAGSVADAANAVTSATHALARYYAGVTEEVAAGVELPSSGGFISGEAAAVAFSADRPVATATARAGAPLDLTQLPKAQRRALTRPPVYYPPDYSGDTRLLDVARNPQPGTRVWRGELRPVGELPEHASSVGMHWSVDPTGTLIRYPEPGYNKVVWQAVVDDPASQTFPRDHPMWTGRHASTDREAEIRFRPGVPVRLEGAWIGRGEGPHGEVNPVDPSKTGSWEWRPLNHVVIIHHRPGAEGTPTHGHADYTELGISHEGSPIARRQDTPGTGSDSRGSAHPPGSPSGAPQGSGGPLPPPGPAGMGFPPGFALLPPAGGHPNRRRRHPGPPGLHHGR